ncbi:hypothetical protein [Nakamurella sp.]|uniref:hypothetical protein n=1 Tax=Nakamurella sp. TaxID=1869182 RepID=UPI003784EB34
MPTLARHRADADDRLDPTTRRERPTMPGSPAQAVLGLQRTAGNRAVAGLLAARAPVAQRYEEQRSVAQRYEVQDCGSGGAHPRSQVDAAHGRARTMLSIAAMESADSSNPTVQALARKYFKLTVPPVTNREKILWFGRVRQVLSGMSTGQDSTTYECEPRQTWKDGLCTPGSFAVTILNIHLCPKWWSLTSIDDRAFVLLHEWAHKHGPSVNQIFETYCDASGFAKEPAEDLVAEPDAYASYIFELVTGGAPTSTVC